ncbi:MAG: hypothetical protein CMO33_09075 [Verrucomicrobia bacterium]|nr:hypothetical protein [Verrucomicrobiota bacterium]
MSDMNDAFWHKGQRNMVGSRCFTGGVFAQKGTSGDAQTTAVVNYSIASTGQIYSMVAVTTIDLSGGSTTNGATERDLFSPHANNPDKTINDDSTNGDVLVRQNAAGVVVSAGNQVRVILTVDVSGNVRGYAGRIVANTATAKRPELDLTDEAAWGEMHITNAHASNDYTIGSSNAQASGFTVVYDDLSFIPSD